MLRYAELRRQGDHQESVSERKALLEQHTLSLEAALTELQSNLTVMYKKIAMYGEIEANLHASSAIPSLDKE